MKPGIPWSVKGIDAETREAAKEAARRAGMTLGAWLNAVILDQSEDDDPPQPLPVARRRMPSPAVSRRRPVTRGRSAEPGEMSERLDSLADKLNALTEGEQETAVDRFMASPRMPARTPDQTVRAILDRLERHEQRTSDTIEEILSRIDGLGRELTELAEEAALPAAPRPEPAQAALELALRNIVDHLEISERRTRDALRSLQQRLGELGQQAAAPPELERLAVEVESLNQRFDDIKTETASDRDLRLLGQTVDQLVSQLGQAHGPDLVALERRIDGLDLGLRQTLEQQHLLQDAIHGLGASDSPQGQMLDALHRQMAQFTERIVTVEGRVGHLAALENAMGQLYRALEEGRAEMSTVAEKVAARVAHGVFAQYPPIAAAPSPELQALQEGLEAVRATSAQADQRSQETLSAVHETLEQIIVKLAELEARGPVSEPAPALAMPQPAATDAVPAESAFVQPEPATAPSMTWQQAVRAHLAAQGQPQPAAPLADFRLPPIAGWPERQSAPQESFSPEHVEPVVSTPRADEVQAAAMRHDFIAAARRAAMAAQPPVGGRRSRPEISSGLWSRLRIARDKAAAESTGDATAPVSGMRRRLLMAGLVLLAMASAYAIGTRELALQKAAPSPAAPAVGTAAPAPAATPPSVPVPPLAVPRLPGPDRLPATTGKTTAIEVLDTIATASLSNPPTSTGSVAIDKAPEGITDALWQAAKSGDREAAFVVASKFLDGREVGKDEAEAARWFERAAAQGLAPAQYRLATLYERGSGVARDVATAGRFYEQAAMQGNIRAMHNLAVLMSGSSGHAVDMTAAARWFREAALQGLKDSQFNLAILHERGFGVARNATEATYWYAVAAAQGDADAKARVEVLRATLPRRDGDEAVRRAAQFRPKEQLRDANVVSVSNPDWFLGPPTIPTVESPIGPLGHNEMIRRTKAGLSRLGFNIGAADSTLDSRTANAIRLFQLRRGLPVNGMVSPDLLGQLQEAG
jgi:localization factor PodJL